MTDDVEELKQAFGRAIIARDIEALDVIFAPWLKPEEELAKIADEVAEMREEWALAKDAWPSGFETGVGALSYANLREPSQLPPGVAIPPEVTEENYAGWHVVTPLAHQDADFDAFFDAWFAVVRLADGLHVGSLELAEPD